MATAAVKKWEGLISLLQEAATHPEDSHFTLKLCKNSMTVEALYKEQPPPKAAWKKLLADKVPQRLLDAVAWLMDHPNIAGNILRTALAMRSAAALLQAADKAGLLYNTISSIGGGSTKSGWGPLAASFQQQLQRSGLVQGLPMFFTAVTELLLDATASSSDCSSSSSTAGRFDFQTIQGKLAAEQLAVAAAMLLKTWQLVMGALPGHEALIRNVSPGTILGAAHCCLASLQYVSWVVQQHQLEWWEPDSYLKVLLVVCLRELWVACERLHEAMADIHSSSSSGSGSDGDDSSGSHGGCSSGSSVDSSGSLQSLNAMFMQCWSWMLPVLLLQPLVLEVEGSSSSNSLSCLLAAAAARVPSEVKQLLQQLGCSTELAVWGANVAPGGPDRMPESLLILSHLKRFRDHHELFSMPSFQALLLQEQEGQEGLQREQQQQQQEAVLQQQQQQQQQQQLTRPHDSEQQVLQLHALLMSVLLQWVNSMEDGAWADGRLTHIYGTVEVVRWLNEDMHVLHSTWQRRRQQQYQGQQQQRQLQCRQQQVQQGIGDHADVPTSSNGNGSDGGDGDSGVCAGNNDGSAWTRPSFPAGVTRNSQLLLLTSLQKVLQLRRSRYPLLLPAQTTGARGHSDTTVSSSNSILSTADDVECVYYTWNEVAYSLVETVIESWQNSNSPKPIAGQTCSCTSNCSTAAPGGASAADEAQAAAAAAAGQACLLLQDYVRAEVTAALNALQDPNSTSSRVLEAVQRLVKLKHICVPGLTMHLPGRRVCAGDACGPLLTNLPVDDPGSQDTMQLFGLICSLGKLFRTFRSQVKQVKRATRQQIEQLEQDECDALWELMCVHDRCFRTSAHVILAVVRSRLQLVGECDLESEQVPTLAAPASRQARSSDGAAAMMPWLMLLGRCYLHWADKVQECASKDCNTQQEQEQEQHLMLMLLPQQHQQHEQDTAATADTPLTDPQLRESLKLIDMWLPFINQAQLAYKQWLTDHAQQLTALGYDPQPLLQQLQQLEAALKAVQALEFTDREEVEAHPASSAVILDMLQQLRAVGLQLTSFASPHSCNNPGCTNVSCASEAELVGGRSCICAGCRTARYCGRSCQRQHWKWHKHVCKALAVLLTESS